MQKTSQTPTDSETTPDATFLGRKVRPGQHCWIVVDPVVAECDREPILSYIYQVQEQYNLTLGQGGNGPSTESGIVTVVVKPVKGSFISSTRDGLDYWCAKAEFITDKSRNLHFCFTLKEAQEKTLSLLSTLLSNLESQAEERKQLLQDSQEKVLTVLEIHRELETKWFPTPTQTLP